MIFLTIFVLFSLNLSNLIHAQSSLEDETTGSGHYTIEGRVFPLSDHQSHQPNWQTHTRIHVNGGEYIGFVRKDGSFIVHNIPSGSYIVEVLNSEYTFEPVRVEINSKGKYRARKVNHIQTSLILQVPYPLRLKALMKTRYFQIREQWRLTDFIFNPMVLMMVLPLVLIMILPKLMNDPETKKEMEQIQNLTKFDLPEVGDMVSNFLAGGNPQGNGGNGNSASCSNTQKKSNPKAKKRQ